MKWIINYGLLLYIGFVFIFGIIIIIFQNSIVFNPMIWTLLLVIYVFILSIYIHFGQRSNPTQEQKNEKMTDPTPNPNN